MRSASWPSGAPGSCSATTKNPEATAEILRDGWLFTGDMARMDEEGFIYLVDRKKDVVISGGENLYPVQIEDFLRRYDKIKDVAVIGLPDKRLGEIAAAIIEIKEDMTCTEEEINSFCKELPRTSGPGGSSLTRSPGTPPARSKSLFCGRSTATGGWWRRKRHIKYCGAFSPAPISGAEGPTPRPTFPSPEK